MTLFPALVAVTLSVVFAATALAGAPDPLKTRTYIDHAWSTLTRSMDDCSALADSKVATRPLLYLPADFPKPAQLDGLATRCHVDLKVLPKSSTGSANCSRRSCLSRACFICPMPTWCWAASSTKCTAGTATSSCSG